MMDAIEVAKCVVEVAKHIQVVTDDPKKVLDEKLLGKIDLQISGRPSTSLYSV